VESSEMVSKRSIGLDIGSRCVKAVCLEGSRDEGYRLVGYGFLDCADGLDRLRLALKDWRLPKGALHLNIEDKSLKIRRVDIPKMDDRDIENALMWSMKGVINDDPERFVFRYIKIPPSYVSASGKIPLVAFAIYKDVVEERLKFAKSIGLGRPLSIEPDSAALAHLFSSFEYIDATSDAVVLDLGHSITRFVVVSGGNILFSRPFSFGISSTLLSRIESSMGISKNDAVALEKRFLKSRLSEEEKGLIEKLLSSLFKEFAEEVTRSIEGYLLVFPGRSISKIYLSGGASRYGGLLRHLQNEIGMDIEMLDPFKYIDTGLFDKANLDTAAASLAVACGLALE